MVSEYSARLEAGTGVVRWVMMCCEDWVGIGGI